MQSTAIIAVGNLAVKRNRLMREELLRGIDKFGKQLPVRLLAHILSYVEARDLAGSQTVCGGWKLPSNLLGDRLWRCLYMQSWEVQSAESPDVALNGANTTWVTRY